MYRMIVFAGMVVLLIGVEAASAADRVFSAEKSTQTAVDLRLGAMLKTIPYIPTTSQDYADFAAQLARELRILHEGGVVVTLEIEPGAAPQPLAQRRPYLDHKGIMQGGGGDQTWLPAYDDDLVLFAGAIASEYGQPHGPVVALALGDVRADSPRRRDLRRQLETAVDGTAVEVRRVERQRVESADVLPVKVAVDRAMKSADVVQIYQVGDGTEDGRVLAAAERFVGQLDFTQLLFAQGPPWVFVFADAIADAAEGTLVVAGDIETVAPNRASLRDIALSDATMHVAAGPYRLYNALGDTVPAVDGGWVVPLDDRGHYMRSDGMPGDFAALVAAVRNARIEGVEPIGVVVRDMTVPITASIESGAVLELTVGNVLNRAIEGELSVNLGELKVEAPAKLRLGPHERQVVEVRVVEGAPSPDNRYPLRVRFDAGVDGLAVHEEEVRVNWIARHSVKVDGKLGDWRDILPQSIGAGATAWVAYDDSYFYFAAKIRDRIEESGTLRFAERDDDTFFYPRVSHELDQDQALYKVDRIRKRSANPAHLRRPDGSGRIDGRWENADQVKAFAIDLTIPEGKPRQVALYIPPGRFDPAGMDIELYDRKRRESLGRQRLVELGQGVYAVYHLAGKVRITLRVHDWHYKARMAGIFFDPVDRASGFVGFDRETSGEWFGRYGAEGFYVVGAERIDPPDVSLRIPKVLKKERRVWPDGVRRFSYRREPVLPSGDLPSFDNVQIAFNAVSASGDPVGIGAYDCTDYEYALNKVSKKYGGGTEVWRLLAPGMARGDFYPRTTTDLGQGAVVDAKLAIEHKDKNRITEAAIPWREIPEVQALMQAGKPVKFSLRINYSQVDSRELATGRSASRINEPAFHMLGQQHWANELQFGWERE